MKLFKLTPADGDWVPWYDKCFGMIIRAEDERQARAIASNHGGDEDTFDVRFEKDKSASVWMNPKETLCVELASDGPAELILLDFKSA